MKAFQERRESFFLGEVFSVAVTHARGRMERQLILPHQKKNPFQSLFADKLVIEVEVKRKVNSHGRHTHTDTLPQRE